MGFLDPVDFIITDPQQRRFGYTAAEGEINEIPGALFSGDGDVEQIFIPNPLPGEYQIELVGVGENVNAAFGGTLQGQLYQGFLDNGQADTINLTVPQHAPDFAHNGTLIEGTGELGDFHAVSRSNDSYWAAHGEVFAFQVSDPVTQFELIASAPDNFIGEMITVDIEASKQSDNAELNIRALLFNHVTGTYVALPGVMSLTTEDSLGSFALPAGAEPTDFIEPGTSDVQLLIQAIQTAGLPNVRTQLDQVTFNFE